MWTYLIDSLAMETAIRLDANFTFTNFLMASVKISGATSDAKHWNGNVVILMKFSSLAAPEVVKMTTFCAASDEKWCQNDISVSVKLASWQLFDFGDGC